MTDSTCDHSSSARSGAVSKILSPVLTGCLIAAVWGSGISGCTKREDSRSRDLRASVSSARAPAPGSALAYVRAGETYNAEAPIPPQCYTKTEGVHNPCYVCHQSYDERDRTNQMNDGFQQGSYAFSSIGETNSWKNLFADRREAIAKISDDEIEKYVATDNYSLLIEWMKTDAWNGVVPEIRGLHEGRKAFDEFGLARDGSRWVAFNYKPFPSTFWPTNGSTDDTMIRLAPKFSERNGTFSRDVYYANLSLVEMAITGAKSVSIPPLDEAAVGVDLDGDGKTGGMAQRMARREHYLGDAAAIEVAHMLYPKDTEFLHTVRYIGVADDGSIYPAPRMKEVRYMRKAAFLDKQTLASSYYGEFKDKHFEKLPQGVRKGDQGTSNTFGWLLLGFIENEAGVLRRQYREEEFACTGCHKSIGATIDQTFGFPRKVAGRDGWRYIDLRAMKDVPNLGETKGEYLTYFERAHGGDEFRQNEEMLERWFDADGKVRVKEVEAAKHVYELIAPSPERALQLNKAYLVTVREQSFLFGRDVVTTPATNVLAKVDTEIPPLRPEHRYTWDLRLSWADPGQ